VGWEVYECESATYAAEVVRRAVLAEQVIDQPVVLHADNGSPMKGETLLETLYRLGISTSYSCSELQLSVNQTAIIAISEPH
jgi:transposase InsO family protein